MAAKKTKKKPTAVAPRFLKWIDDTGPTKVAELLGVTRFNVYGWRRYAAGEEGGYRPDPGRLAAIIRVSVGALTAADIYPEQT